MNWLVGHWDSVWMVSAKAALLAVTALLGLRVGVRRPLAQMSLFDFVTATALGAIIGRAATANTTSYLEGAVAIVTILIVHWLISMARFNSAFARLVDHPVRIVVVDGRIRPRELRRCSLTRADVEAVLRQHGVTDLGDVAYLLYEHAGRFTVVPAGRRGPLINSAIT
ncbi:DUF421 domain-containing protein [Nocardia terpenica]|uniref:DUF421 domain-containing protein n=1 Tax=Nocardia terpenica TaxID=455432 RepID=UPI00189380D6|nr:YetF domain-containing protein [Nocardia terpenica]MBF6064671.1 DUF421 domain-containing protein [Nocardia terpenica]MBF6107187.1 DUF421 domain-containing protein [Nocardia terpenica]MBF6114945.1 DUF421 domain-containing protein [Nocardia terpenica]MBF6122050.1 DUF421 domain-containing protein [Nocardia terpenica]MBF6154433.1 DUF421 domain-containing protein [Nocardia terpenica]